MKLTLPPLQGAGFWVAFWQVAAVYYGFAALIHWVVPALFEVETVQVGKRRPGQVRKEALLSVGPIAVKALVFTVVERLSLRPGLTRLYSGPISGPSGWLYAAATVAALDALHDAWFYFTHRWMHSWRFLYKNVHSLHHESTVPTAFTGYAFHPVEGLIVFANEVLVTFLFPIHVGLHRAYHLWTTVIHNGGHAGYEIAPFIPSLAAFGAGAVEVLESLFAGGGRRRAREGRGGGGVGRRRRGASVGGAEALATSSARAARAALNTVRHHDMHHRFPFAHFSLYFTHWDRLLGTEHAGYRAAVEAHFSKRGERAVGRTSDGAAADDSAEEKGAEHGPSCSSGSDGSIGKRFSKKAGGLERLSSAMEEYAAKDKGKRIGIDGGGDGHGSAGDVTSNKHGQRHQQRRPSSPAIGAYYWSPAFAAGGDGSGSSSEGGGVGGASEAAPRRSSRLARAA